MLNTLTAASTTIGRHQYKYYTCHLLILVKISASLQPSMISLLESNPTVGIVGTDYIFDHSGSPNYSNINSICDFPVKNPLSGFYANTFYMIRGTIVKFLLKNVNINFFNKFIHNHKKREPKFPISNERSEGVLQTQLGSITTVDVRIT